MSNKHRIEINSLCNFVYDKKSFWEPALNILEIGCGSESLFEQQVLGGPAKITAIDREKVLIEKAKSQFNYSEVDYLQRELSDIEPSSRFDLIIDAHSLHFSIGDLEIFDYLTKVSELLSKDGVFMGEVMTYNKGLLFEAPYYFDHNDYILYKAHQEKIVPQRSIYTAYMWEQLLLKRFKIEYFYVDQGLCFDLPKLLESKVSLLKFICKKC